MRARIWRPDEGDLSRVCAVQDGVSGFELEVVEMLRVYVIEAVKIPLSGSVAGFAGDIGAGADKARYFD